MFLEKHFHVLCCNVTYHTDHMCTSTECVYTFGVHRPRYSVNVQYVHVYTCMYQVHVYMYIGKSIAWRADGRGFESHPRQPIFL